jgi:hypothetical protein
MNKLVRNEQCKLKANYYNGIAIAAVGVGGLAQAAAMVQEQSFSTGITVFVVICAVASYALHSLAKAILTEMEE